MTGNGYIRNRFPGLENVIRQYSAPVVFVFVLILLISDILYPDAIVLTFTHVALIGILLILPYVQYIQRVKWGPFEAELDRQIEETRESVASLSATSSLSLSSLSPSEARQNNVKQQLLMYVADDPKVAVVTLWMKIEDALQVFIQDTDDDSPQPYQELTKSMQENPKVSPNLLRTVQQLRNLRNEALHGGEITEDDAKEIIDIGTELLGYLYNQIDLEEHRDIDPLRSDQD